jgi:serine acetyltransferase
MSVKSFLRVLYLPEAQVRAGIALSRGCARLPIIGPTVGKALSILIDNMLLTLFGIEVRSTSLQIGRLIVGHSTGVVLGGNGIRCTGTLLVSSGVVFARRHRPSDQPDPEFFFDIDGDLTVGANSVLMGPLKVKGPVTIGALTLVSHDITEPGTYVGMPARRLEPAARD